MWENVAKKIVKNCLQENTEELVMRRDFNAARQLGWNELYCLYGSRAPISLACFPLSFATNANIMLVSQSLPFPNNNSHSFSLYLLGSGGKPNQPPLFSSSWQRGGVKGALIVYCGYVTTTTRVQQEISTHVRRTLRRMRYGDLLRPQQQFFTCRRLMHSQLGFRLLRG